MAAVTVLSHGFNVMRGMLAGNQYSDLDLVTVEGKAVSCHKVVLCSVSERVRSMLAKKDAKQIVIRNVSYEGLDNLIKFIYEGKIDINTNESLNDFVDALTVMRCNLGQKVANMVKNISLEEDSASSQPSQGKKNSCETCGKSFKTMKILNRHIREVHNKKLKKNILKKKLHACERCKTEYKVYNPLFFIGVISLK